MTQHHLSSQSHPTSMHVKPDPDQAIRALTRDTQTIGRSNNRGEVHTHRIDLDKVELLVAGRPSSLLGRITTITAFWYGHRIALRLAFSEENGGSAVAMYWHRNWAQLISVIPLMLFGLFALAGAADLVIEPMFSSNHLPTDSSLLIG